MKKIILLLLIGFLSCSENETVEPIEPEPTCYVMVGKSTGNGDKILCDSGLLLKVVEQKKYLSGNYNFRDKIEICVTNEKYKFNEIRSFQVFCDLEDLTN
jgi:hypothetical protein